MGAWYYVSLEKIFLMHMHLCVQLYSLCKRVLVQTKLSPYVKIFISQQKGTLSEISFCISSKLRNHLLQFSIRDFHCYVQAETPSFNGPGII